MASKKNELATANAGEVVVSNDLPEWLQGKGDARGAENVTTDDMIIPRIELVQALSPARKKSDAAYIEGAEEGMLYNNVTRELYGEAVTVVPIYYTKQFLVWKDRKSGGGGSNGGGDGAAGGSGIAIVRSGRAAASYTGSPTITMAGSDYVYTFTGNGSITF